MSNRIARSFRTLKTLAAVVCCGGLFAITALPGCGVYMEATRPTPVDLAQFHPGQSRDTVREEVGAPQGNANEADGAACDFYNLYTHGYGAGGKVGVAFLEGAADVLTIGMAEVVNTPVEAATRNEKHPVTFCYKDGKLARISEGGHQIMSDDSAASQASATVPTSPPSPAQPGAASASGASNVPSAATLVSGQTAASTNLALPAAVASAPEEAPSAGAETTSHSVQ